MTVVGAVALIAPAIFRQIVQTGATGGLRLALYQGRRREVFIPLAVLIPPPSEGPPASWTAVDRGRIQILNDSRFEERQTLGRFSVGRPGLGKASIPAYWAVTRTPRSLQ